MKQSLYEITENLKSLYEMHENAWDIFDNKEANQEEGKTLVEELSAALAIGEKEFKEKMEDYARLIKNLKHKINIKNDEMSRLNDEITRIKASINRDESLINLLSHRMKEALVRTGNKSVDTGLFRVSTRKYESVEANTFHKLIASMADVNYDISLRNDNQVIPVPISIIPENIMDIIKQYSRVKVTIEPDKAAIKKALKDGQNVPGAEIKITENIEIR